VTLRVWDVFGDAGFSSTVGFGVAGTAASGAEGLAEVWADVVRG
jgi:hypothetical protein